MSLTLQRQHLQLKIAKHDHLFSPFMVQSDSILIQLSSSLTPFFSAHPPCSTSFPFELLHLHCLSMFLFSCSHTTTFLHFIASYFLQPSRILNCFPISTLPNPDFSLTPSASHFVHFTQPYLTLYGKKRKRKEVPY